MKESIVELFEQCKSLVYLLPAAIGGLVDYMNQVQNGKRKWQFFQFCIHIFSAAFFGWMVGSFVAELGYQQGFSSAAAGFGGFLGVRVADLLIYKLFGKERRK
jgi:uncharacterized membrane protein